VKTHRTVAGGWKSEAAFLAFTLILITFVSERSDAAQVPHVQIGIVIDGPWERNDEVLELFKQEILELTRGEFDVRFAPEKTIVADWTSARVAQALDTLFADPDVDLVLAMGVLASDVVCRRAVIEKPVVAPFVIDGRVQGLPRENGASGVRNLSYISSSISFRRDLEVFLEIAPFHHLTILSTWALGSFVPELQRRVEDLLAELSIEASFVNVRGSAEEALAALPPETEAVYVFPLLELLPGEMDRLIAGLIERRLPSFSRFGRSEVERGILAGLSEEHFPRRARRTALHVQRILLGEDPSTFAVDFQEREQLRINMATARAIGVYPTFELMTIAELVDEQRRDITRSVDLRSAMNEAIDVNLDLRARDREVAAGAEEIGIAKSFLLPELDLAGTGVLIDRDRSQATGQPERFFAPSLTLTQAIYSESAHANYRIQEQLQQAREYDRESLRLDIAQEAATAYLNVLRTKTSERILKDNLEVTRSNLELARARETIGFSGPAEVYRWESQIAAARSAVITATANRNQAEIALNRLLHRPLEEPFLTEEIGLEDPSLDYIRVGIQPYVSSPGYFDLFRDFMTERGLLQSPELSSFNAAINVRERSLLASRRAFFVPDVFFQGNLERPFRGGASSSGLGVLGDVATMFPELGLSRPNDFNWTLALDVSIPLFTSGYRTGVRDRDIEELSRLRLEREALAERIEQRIRSALHAAGATLAGIGLARDAAAATRSNLDLVTDAYSRGAVSIIDLLDAQNASLVAEEAAANATYDFLIDVFEVARSAGRIYYLGSPEEREQLLKEIDAYFRKRGVSPPRGRVP
jgi:outer membrane protein